MKLVVDKESLVSVADAIREKGGTSESLTFPQGFVDGIGAIESGGGTEEIENLIDQSGVLDSTEGSVTEKVEQLIDKADVFKKTTGISFGGTDIETITLDCSNMTMLSSAFNGCLRLKEVHLSNTQKVSDWRYTFYTVNSIRTIETLNLSGLTKSGLWLMSGVGGLETFKVVPQTISVSINIPAPKLSDGTNGTFNSIQSVIDGLATVETKQKLTLHTNVVLKLTADQMITITEKNWEVG